MGWRPGTGGVEQDGVRLWGREGANYELESLRRLPPGTMLDGELVMIRDGMPDFQALAKRDNPCPKGSPF